jgi:hypothetical protein
MRQARHVTRSSFPKESAMNSTPPGETPSQKIDNLLDGRDDPNRGPLDRAANALDGRDDPNRGPVDRMENALSGSSQPESSSAFNWPSGEQGIISAVFDSDDEARHAISALRSEGVDDASLSLITQRRGTTTTSNVEGDVVDEDHSNYVRGIIGGGALGAGLGVLALAIPGVGPLVAAGAIAASAVPEAMAIGAAAGAALGTANEALKKHGVSDDDVEYYGRELKNRGSVLVTVHPHGEASHQRIREILYANGGHNAAQPRNR